MSIALAAPRALCDIVADQSARACPQALSTVVESVQAHFGDSLQAVVFYGSCLRSADPTEGLVDVYALVDDYRRAYSQWHLRWFNAALPPNVFYLECPHNGAVLRCKCTVFSLADFEHGIGHWFHSYLWGRFAQPVRLVYARDESVRRRVDRALALAVLVFLRRTAPCLDGEFSVETLWSEGLRRSYTAELRAENSQGRASQLAAADLDDYRQRTAAAASVAMLEPVAGSERYCSSAGSRERTRAVRAWRLRRWQGRVLSVLRLIKNATTFTGGVDYVAWKIERHTGVHVEVTPRLRRYPLIFGWGVLWRLLRRGALR